VLWALRAEDLPLAVRVFNDIGGLKDATSLFITGQATEESSKILDSLRGSGTRIENRRIGLDDLLKMGEKSKRSYYCCSGTSLMTNLSEWLKDENMVFESFNY
jgi:hypothetical protein